jgi:hypothetical protein
LSLGADLDDKYADLLDFSASVPDREVSGLPIDTLWPSWNVAYKFEAGNDLSSGKDCVKGGLNLRGGIASDVTKTFSGMGFRWNSVHRRKSLVYEPIAKTTIENGKADT